MFLVKKWVTGTAKSTRLTISGATPNRFIAIWTKFRLSIRHYLHSTTTSHLIKMGICGLFLFFLFPSESSAIWFNATHDYRKQITISSTMVSTTNHTNFPVFISFTNNDFKTIPNGGNMASGSGEFVVTSSDGVTVLPHEIETYTATTGALEAWVNVPTLSSTANTVLYIYYGGPGPGTATNQNKTGTWNSNFVGVYHFGSPTTLSVRDSSAGAHHVVTNNGVVAGTGKMGGGAGSGTGDYLDLGVVADHNFLDATNYTITAWFNTTSIATTQGIVQKFNSGVAGQWTHQTINSSVRFVRNVTPFSGEGATDLSSDTWYYSASRYDGTNVILRYNATQDFTGAFGNVPTNTTTRTLLGSQESSSVPNNPFLGVYDEIRISNVARTDGWLTTEYNNQNSPSTYITLGTTEESIRRRIIEE